MLEINGFEFNNQTYLQKSGVSMDIRFAPSFGDIFMAKWKTGATMLSSHHPTIDLKRLVDSISKYAQTKLFQTMPWKVYQEILGEMDSDERAGLEVSVPGQSK